TSRLSAALGVPVRIERLSLKLSQGIKVRNFSLGLEDAEILSAEEIILKCNFLEMLHRRFNVQGIVVERPVLTLQKDQIGVLLLLLPKEVLEPLLTLIWPKEVVQGLLQLIPTHNSSSVGKSEFQFQLAQARVHDGEVNVESGRSDSLTVDEIDLEISSEGKGRPVDIKAVGKMRAFDFSIIGSYGDEAIPVNFGIVTEMDWSNVKSEILDTLNLKKIPDLKGTGKSKVDITLTGSPDELNIDVASDLTKNDLSYGNLFHKPGGLATKFKMSSVYSLDRLEFSPIDLELGKSRISVTGFFDRKEKMLNLEVKSDSVIIPELAKCIPGLKDIEMEGEGKLDLEISRTGTEAIESKGKIEVKDWRYRSYAGNYLACNIKNKGGRTRVDDIVAIIGEGRLTGSGEIFQSGKYKFSIKGENIDMEKFFSLKEKDEVKLNISGKGKINAQISNSSGEPKGLNGEGSFQIQNGMIQSFSWLEDLFSTIHLPELMPFKYTQITGSFSITDGKVDIEETVIDGKDAIFTTEEGEIDLIRRTKKISADFALAPRFVERERAKFKEFDKLFYVDENGFAHLSIVWSGPLSKGTPDLAASLLKTGIKKYGTELLEKLFGEDDDQ
ncbi:hypothetical protein KAS33_03185, partial [bacterium]|nr:hypothetical protein [bacterium]